MLKPHLVENKTKRRVVNVILFGSISFISVSSTLGMAIYREDFKMFKGLNVFIENGAFNKSNVDSLHARGT